MDTEIQVPGLLSGKPCECGCGRATRIATQTRTAQGHIKGRPVRFIHGHWARVRPTKSPADRLWAKVDRSAGPTACWPFTGHKNSDGYGHIWVAGRLVQAHRLAWELAHPGEPIPPGLEVCHTVCDNPPCCNPRHMTTKLHKGNMEEMMAKGRHRALRGEQNGNVRLTTQQVLEIRRLHAAEGLSERLLARRFGVDYSTVHLLLSGRTWGWLQEMAS